MNLLRHARKIEAGITRVIDGAIRSRPGTPLEPLELVHAVVGRIGSETVASGRGKETFPFNQVRVFIATPTREARARFAAVAETEPTLPARIQARLRAAGCDVDDLAVKVTFTPAPAAHWTHPQWHVEFARVAAIPDTPVAEAAPDPAPAPPVPEYAVTLQIVKGSATPKRQTFTQARVDIGRCAEVHDQRHRLLRTNDVVVADTDDPVNQSVSRCHAHLVRTEDGYRLLDDRSAHGTTIVRDGRAVAVPPGSRGVRLRSGDVVCVGEVRLTVQIQEGGIS